MLDKQGYTQVKHARTNAHALAYASTRPGTHTYALARTRRQICNTLLFNGKNDLRTRLSVTLYVRYLSSFAYTVFYFILLADSIQYVGSYFHLDYSLS
jgi:hypothetical protein